MELGLRRPDRREESRSLDVVDMQVGEEQIDPRWWVGGELDAEGPRAGPRIEDQHPAVGGPDLDAGGVAAVAHRAGARSGDRTAAPPDPDAHLSRLGWFPEDRDRADRLVGV